jgi:hyperosmotically inducible protein
MIRALLKAIIVIVLVVGALAFFFGYRMADLFESRDAGRPVGTTGRSGVDTSRARDAGAKAGERVAVAANEARDAISDGNLTGKIKAKMALDELVKARDIDVDTDNGVVTLTGTVGSDAERQRALQLARETTGVKSVVDRLRVR